MSSKATILLTGGTGKVASRIAPLLSSNGNSVLVASRSSKAPSLANCQGVRFDWDDTKTYSAPFEDAPVSAVFLVCPPTMDCFPPMKQFIDLAIQKGVKRFILLSASVADLGDGPSMAKVSKYITERGVEYAILKPTWFMQNFSEAHHLHSIREDKICTATGQGKVPFVSVDDIAAVAFRALVDEVPHNTDHLILGPDLLSYDEVADLLTAKLGRKITHVNITEKQLATAMESMGIPKDYANMLAVLDTAIKNGAENRTNDVVEKVTGKKPRGFESFVDECVERGVWAKK